MSCHEDQAAYVCSVTHADFAVMRTEPLCRPSLH